MFSTGLADRSRRLRQALRKWGIAVAATIGLWIGAADTGLPGAAAARTFSPDAAAPGTPAALQALPEQAREPRETRETRETREAREARETHGLGLGSGPSAHRTDACVFLDRERLLPGQQRGFHGEYAIRTPGSRDRSARHAVCGGEPPTQPQACFYTADHSAGLRRIGP